MNKKRWLAFSLMLILVCLTLTSDYVYAEDVGGTTATTQDDGHNMLFDVFVRFPKEEIEKVKEQTGYEVEYAKYESSRYTLEFAIEGQNWWDLADKAENIGHYTLYQLDNTIWQVLLSWDFTVISAIQHAFTLNIVDEFADEVQNTIQQLAGFNGATITSGRGLWGQFFLFAIVLSGAWFAYRGLVKRDQTNTITSVLTMMFIIMASFAFFANAGKIMKDLNDISSGISTEIMGISLVFDKEVNQDSEKISDRDNKQETIDGEEKKSNNTKTVGDSIKYPYKLADKVYNLLVKEPYLMLQYGDVDVNKPSLNKKRIESLLNEKPGSEQRKNIVKKEVAGYENYSPNTMMTTKGTFQRLSILLLLCLTHFVIGVVFFITAGAIILYQFFFIIFALFAPIALLLAIYPPWSNIAVNWLKKLIGYQLIKIVLGLFLSILLTISYYLYRVVPPDKYGYAWTIIVQLILVVGVMWKRSDLINIINASVGSVSSSYNDPGFRKMLKQVSGYAASTSARLEKFKLRK